MKFSANLWFLWADRPLAEAIRAAKDAGFDAVECHWPYDQPLEDVQKALQETGLPMLGVNTRRGKPGENGLAALPGRDADAKAAIAEAIGWAEATDTSAIHVMAGFAQGEEARAQFCKMLRHACDGTDHMILIEPLNRHDAPGYFLTTTDQAAGIIRAVDRPNLKLMFDCYHVGRTEGDICTRLEALLPLIGHIQFASVPARGTPDQGEQNYETIFAHIAALGWDKPLGAEYKPVGDTDASLGWLKRFR